MKVYYDVNLENFEAWSGAVDTLTELTHEELLNIQSILEDSYPEEGEGMSETELNDFLWFEKDTIADWLGYEDWEDLLNHKEERWED